MCSRIWTVPSLLLALQFAAHAAPPTYENFGERFFTAYCTSCHHTTRSAEERHGAPGDINFDNLAMIQEVADTVMDAVSGPAPKMPPANGVWPWDRQLLHEWLTAGCPGEGVEHLPPMNLPPPDATSEWYERMSMDVSRPNGFPLNQRMVHITGLQHFTGKQNVLEEQIEVRREPDGSIVMLSQRRRRDGIPSNPFVKHLYSPPVPLVLADMAEGAVWSQTVQAVPRFDNGSMGAPVSIDFTVTAEGFEVLDNGVGAPVEGFRVRVFSHNPGNPRNPDTEEIWWFEIGKGPVRFVRTISPLLYSNVPGAEEGLDKAYLAAAPEIRDDTQSYFPFENRTRNWNFEHQRKILLSVDSGGTATETPTLGPDFSRTPSPSPTVTSTPANTETVTHTQTLASSPTSTQTDLPDSTPTSTATSSPAPSPSATQSPVPEPTVTPTWSSQLADQDGDGAINQRDLVHFLKNWGTQVPPPGNQPPQPGDPRRSDMNQDQMVSPWDLWVFSMEWRGEP